MSCIRGTIKEQLEAIRHLIITKELNMACSKPKTPSPKPPKK